ncbi:MAG: hypothetical protein IKD35_03640 [Clostridia bacterium]|nr:hypothetical protein [Clostridia bacterium]
MYNGVLGGINSSVWNGAICVYYLLLAVLRGTIAITERNLVDKSNEYKYNQRKKVFYSTSIVLIVQNFAIVVPIVMMIFFQRNVNVDIITAIAIAVHTVYKVVVASTNLKKRKQSTNILVREVTIINFIDALVSIMVMQNTLIMTMGGEKDPAMLILSSTASAVMMSAAIGLNIFNVVSTKKYLQKQSNVGADADLDIERVERENDNFDN